MKKKNIKSNIEYCPKRQTRLEGIEDLCLRCKLTEAWTRYGDLKRVYEECNFHGNDYNECPIYKNDGPLFSSSGYMGCSAGAMR